MIQQQSVKKMSIKFINPGKKDEGIIKFGGQPDWLLSNEWPISETTGNPMMFVCQISPPKEIFGKVNFAMAYLFITDKLYDNKMDVLESVIILQPGNTEVKVKEIVNGPTIYEDIVDAATGKLLGTKPCQFAAQLYPGEDKEIHPTHEDYVELSGTKIGGLPMFLQEPEFSEPEWSRWQLLIQLDTTDMPFHIDLGDAGIGYIFIDEKGDRAKFLWQCL